MFRKSTITAVALVAITGMAAPAFAKTHRTAAHHRARPQIYNSVRSVRSDPPLSPFDPALTGGGNVGWNAQE